MTDKIGQSKIQKPASKRYSFVSIPKPIEAHLQATRDKELCWIGIHIGDKEDNEPIAVSFIHDKTKSIDEQINRIMKLLFD